MTSNHLTHKFQSAYRAGHSTEIALLRIVNDILTASDANQVSVLTLLDLSAAFDTIDHSILLCRLEKHFGFFLVLPSAGSSHTCQTGFSLFPHAAVTPSYPSLIMGCHKGRCWAQFCLCCTHNLFRRSYSTTPVRTDSLLMTHNCANNGV